jgi:biotin carboxyl carrier protein
LKLRVDVNGEAFLLELLSNGAYSLRGESERSGSASVEEVMPGVFSVLLNDRSVLVHVAPHPQGFEVSAGLDHYFIALADPRDKAVNSKKSGAEGPVELRAQMPGKIIKLLAEEGSLVVSGQGLIVVEAMKMQNEVKSPKDGTLTRIHVAEGGTVSAGDPLLVVE